MYYNLALVTTVNTLTVKEIRKLKSQDSRTSECLRFTGPNRISLVRQKNLKTAAPYWIIMKLKTPEKFEKLFPNDHWLLVPWWFYVWHPHHTSRDRSRFLCMILFINNMKNTFYETKALKTKHVSFLKYIYNTLLISYRTFGPVSLRNLPVQHEISRSRSVTNFDRCTDTVGSTSTCHNYHMTH